MKLQVTELNLFRSAVCVARTFKEALLDLGSKTLPVCLFGGRRRVCLHVTWSIKQNKKLISGSSESLNCFINGETTSLPAPFKSKYQTLCFCEVLLPVR